jgi:transcriptional regulator with XRE-family HTH domain
MEIKVGEIIKAKREDKEYSLVEFAREVGISPGYLSQIENGYKRNPKLDIVLKMIKLLDIDIDMLLGLDEKKTRGIKVPSLFQLIIARERNQKVLEDKDVLKKICNILDKSLECKYLISDEDYYRLFLEDVCIQLDTTLKRYLAVQAVNNIKEK